MLEHARLLSCSFALLMLPALAGCNGSAGGQPSADEKKAAEAKQAKEDADAAAIAERKAKREAREKAEAEAAKKRDDEVARLCVLPPTLPKDPVAACEAVGKAHDEFVRRVGTPEIIAAWEGGESEKTIPMAVVQCTQADSLEAAACQKNALDNADAQMLDHTKLLLQTCIDKFPSKRRGGAPVLKKRPG
jgi:hypothetical protein